MIRKLNYTGRLRIERANVTVKVLRGPGGTPTDFDCTFRIAEYGLPKGAAVFIESYYRSWYKRFPFGTVVKPQKPSSTDLGEAGVQYMRFRIKVVDKSGKILAEADNVLPEDLEPANAIRQCILPINYLDLGERLWDLDYECGQIPALEVNNKISHIGLQVKELITTPRFAPLVFPAALNELLRRILECGPNDDETSPESLWLKFVSTFYASPPPTSQDADEIAIWIKGAVKAFSDRHKFASQYGSYFGEQPTLDSS